MTGRGSLIFPASSRCWRQFWRSRRVSTPRSSATAPNGRHQSLSWQLAAEVIQLSNRDPFLGGAVVDGRLPAGSHGEARSADRSGLRSGAGGDRTARRRCPRDGDGDHLGRVDDAGRVPLTPVSASCRSASTGSRRTPTGTFGSGDRSSALAFLPRSRTVLSGGKDRIIGWDLTDSAGLSGNVAARVLGYTDSITVAADGNHVAAVGGELGRVLGQGREPLASGRGTRSPARERAVGGLLARRSALATGTDYQRVDLWAVSDDGLAPVSSMTLPGPDLQLATGLAFAANGRSLVTRLRLQGWRCTTSPIRGNRNSRGCGVRRRRSSAGSGSAATASRVAVASSDNTVRIYEVATPIGAQAAAQSRPFDGVLR